MKILHVNHFDHLWRNLLLKNTKCNVKMCRYEKSKLSLQKILCIYHTQIYIKIVCHTISQVYKTQCLCCVIILGLIYYFILDITLKYSSISVFKLWINLKLFISNYCMEGYVGVGVREGSKTERSRRIKFY